MVAVFLGVFFGALLASAAEKPALPPMISPAAMSGVFVEGAKPTFTAPKNFDRLSWTVLDWQRRELRRGEWATSEPLVLEAFPKGYYLLEATAGEEKIRPVTFCVVPDPKTRIYPSDSFYGVDAALSSLARPEYTALNWYGEDCAAATLELIRLSGLVHVRERLHWASVTTNGVDFKWGGYAKNVEHAKKRELRLLGMFHSVAPYAGTDSKTPTDLKALYEFCRAYGLMGGETMAGWEFWNEEDVGFWTDTAWNYVACMKAAYLGFKAANPKTPVLNGAVCQEVRNDFDEVLFRNDLAKYSNVWGYHLYVAPANYERYYRDSNEFLARQGLDNRARWITESSNNVEGDATEPALAHAKLKAHSHVQELAVAETYAKYRILMQMNGVSRDYFFVFGAYNEREGTKDWGVQRRDGSVKPLYAAISATTEHLVAAKLIGEKRVGEGIRLFVFEQPDGSQSIAYWTVSPCDQTRDGVRDLERTQRDLLRKDFTLSGATGVYRGSNWCGSPFETKATGGSLALTAERYVTFLNGFKGLSVDETARPRGAVEEYRPAADEDLTVVIRADFSPKDFDITDNKTVAELRTGRDSGRATFHVWNLSDTPKKGRLAFKKAAVKGLPDEISLAPWSVADVEVEIGISDPKADFADTELVGIFNGRRTSRVFMPMRNEDRFVAGCDVIPANSNRADFWKINDSAPEHSVIWDEVEKAVRFEARWTDPKADRWFYPVHMFGKDEAPATLDGTTMIEFEARLEQDKVENDVSTPVLMPVTPPGSPLKLLWVKWTPPTRQWQKMRIPLMNRDGLPSCNGASGFRLGFKPKGKVVTYWIRNLSYVKPRKTVAEPKAVSATGATEVTFNADGSAALLDEGVSLGMTVFARGWASANPAPPKGTKVDTASGCVPMEMLIGRERVATGALHLDHPTPERVDYGCRATFDKDFDTACYAVTFRLDTAKFGGMKWTVSSGETGVLPVEADAFPLGTFTATGITIGMKDGRTLRISTKEPSQVLIYDNRSWGHNDFSFRIQPILRPYKAGETVDYSVTFGVGGPLEVVAGSTEVILAGEKWKPIDFKKDILSGSALDLSNVIAHEVPAGRYGRVKAVGDHFEFEGKPGVVQRFAGVDLCGEVNCPEKTLAERLVMRYRRLGYNAVRFHHHESDLVKGSPDRLAFNAENIDRFDWNVKLLIDNGFYFTTDLYVSRPVNWRDIGFDRDGPIGCNAYKTLVTAGHPEATENWKRFARQFLEHRNPHTGRTLLEEPALLSLVLVNEAHLGMDWAFISKQPFFKQKFAAWLRAKRAADPTFYPGVSEDPEKIPNARTDEGGICTLLHNEIEAETARTLIAWLRSIGCVTPIATDNNRATVASSLLSDEPFDIVDQHAYIDHPSFLGAAWASACRYGNENPFLDVNLSFTRGLAMRVADRPFTVSEWNFGGTSSYRSMAGLAIGGIAAVQGWGASWRFCYSHGIHKVMDNGGWVDSFEQTGDPLRQLTDATFNLLYLRGDLPEATQRAAIVLPEEAVLPRKGKPVGCEPKWRRDALWSVKTGLSRNTAPGGWCPVSRTEPPAAAPSAFAFEAQSGTMTLATEKTCAIFAEAGTKIAAGALEVELKGHRATVAVSALDGASIASSKRLLVTHLTNVLNEGLEFADRTRRTVLNHGRGSRARLVAVGEAEIALALDEPRKCRVWAIATDGARLEEVPVRVEGNRLRFTASTAGSGKPRLAYEVAVCPH